MEQVLEIIGKFFSESALAWVVLVGGLGLAGASLVRLLVPFLQSRESFGKFLKGRGLVIAILGSLVFTVFVVSPGTLADETVLAAKGPWLSGLAIFLVTLLASSGKEDAERQASSSLREIISNARVTKIDEA